MFTFAFLYKIFFITESATSIGQAKPGAWGHQLLGMFGRRSAMYGSHYDSWCAHQVIGWCFKIMYQDNLCRAKQGTYTSLLQWCYNGHDGVSNHQPHDCLSNRLFRRRSKKTSKLRVLAFARGIHRGPVNSPRKWPVTRKMFPFDDVIMPEGASLHLAPSMSYREDVKNVC